MRIAIFFLFFVIFRCESVELWGDVSCDMSPEKLSTIYKVEKRSFEMEVLGYSEFIGKPFEKFGVAFIPSFIFITDLVKEVSLFYEYDSPLIKQLYNEVLEYHFSKYGEPSESVFTKGYSYQAKWEQEKIEVLLKVQTHNKSNYYQYPKGISIRFLCKRPENNKAA